MARYLTAEQLRTSLNLGKPIEQWLGYVEKEAYVVLRWLSIHQETGHNYSVNYFECIDEGDDEFFDIYEFGA